MEGLAGSPHTADSTLDAVKVTRFGRGGNAREVLLHHKQGILALLDRIFRFGKLGRKGKRQDGNGGRFFMEWCEQMRSTQAKLRQSTLSRPFLLED